jgi:hypothetical protein
VKVGRGDKGWEISVVPIELSPKGKELFRVDRLVRSRSQAKPFFDKMEEHTPAADGISYRLFI